MNHVKIGFDIDNTICCTYKAFIKRIEGQEREVDEYMDAVFSSENFEKLHWDEDFWLSLKPLITKEQFYLQPTVYITGRNICKSFTLAWLYENDLPRVPLVNNTEDKVEACIEWGLTHFVDDKPQTFIDLHEAGIRCYLMDYHYNRNVDTVIDGVDYRVKTVQEAIKRAYIENITK